MSSEEQGLTRELVVEEPEKRLDLYLARQEPDLTRSRVRRLLDEGYILVNGDVPKASRTLRSGDRISLIVPPPRPAELAPEAMPLNIIYQDSEVLVVDKPAGLAVHPGPGHPSRTLVNALLSLFPELGNVGEEFRPGVVHRLDKDTSGLMVVAKTSPAHRAITRQIKDRTTRKGYLALARGRVSPEQGVFEAPIGRDPRNRKRMAVVEGGRQASTSYRVRRHLAPASGEYTYLEVFPETGRTHQIRVHFAYAGHPLFGDALYWKRSPLLGRQFLHAHLLGFQHPSTDRYMEFSSLLPQELHRVLEALER